LIFSAVAISSSASPFLPCCEPQYAEHMIGEEMRESAWSIAGTGVRLCELSRLVTSGSLITERL